MRDVTSEQGLQGEVEFQQVQERGWGSGRETRGCGWTGGFPWPGDVRREETGGV